MINNCIPKNCRNLRMSLTTGQFSRPNGEVEPDESLIYRSFKTNFQLIECSPKMY